MYAVSGIHSFSAPLTTAPHTQCGSHILNTLSAYMGTYRFKAYTHSLSLLPFCEAQCLWQTQRRNGAARPIAFSPQTPCRNGRVVCVYACFVCMCVLSVYPRSFVFRLYVHFFVYASRKTWTLHMPVHEYEYAHAHTSDKLPPHAHTHLRFAGMLLRATEGSSFNCLRAVIASESSVSPMPAYW